MTTSDQLLLLVAPIVGLLTFAVTQIGYNWLMRGRRLLIGFFLGLLTGWIVQLFCTSSALIGGDVAWWDRCGLGLVNQFTYLALADGYIHFVNIMICSLRLRVLHELLTTEEGLSVSGILARYNARELVEARLERLRGSGRLAYAEGRYYTRFTTLLTLARFYRLLKLVLLGRRPTKMSDQVQPSGEGNEQAPSTDPR